LREDKMSEGAERELEQEIGQVLLRLPVPRAPEDFLAGVMREVGAIEALPWYRAGWFNWPVGWRAASAALVGAFLIGVVGGAPLIEAWVGELLEGPVSSRMENLLAPLFGAAALLRVGFVATAAVGRIVPVEVVGGLALAALLMTMATVVLGAALRRLSLGRELFR